MVSVVITTFNRARLLPDAIESILRQEYSDYEIVIVDDGSTDATAQVVKKYIAVSGKRTEDINNKQDTNRYPLRAIRYFYQENKGIACARNRGVREAKGELVAFLDSDDVADSEWLAKSAALFSNSNISVVCGRTLSYTPLTVLQEVTAQAHAPSKLAVSCAGFVDFFIGTNVIFRRSVFDTVGMFDSALRYGDDIDFLIRINHSGSKIYYEPQAIVYYRHRDNLWAFMKQRFGYGLGRVFLYKKYPEIRKNILEDTKHFFVKGIQLTLRMIKRVFEFIFVPGKKDGKRVAVFLLILVGMTSNYCGRLYGRMKYKVWF